MPLQAQTQRNRPADDRNGRPQFPSGFLFTMLWPRWPSAEPSTTLWSAMARMVGIAIPVCCRTSSFPFAQAKDRPQAVQCSLAATAEADEQQEEHTRDRPNDNACDRSTAQPTARGLDPDRCRPVGIHRRLETHGGSRGRGLCDSSYPIACPPQWRACGRSASGCHGRRRRLNRPRRTPSHTLSVVTTNRRRIAAGIPADRLAEPGLAGPRGRRRGNLTAPDRGHSRHIRFRHDVCCCEILITPVSTPAAFDTDGFILGIDTAIVVRGTTKLVVVTTDLVAAFVDIRLFEREWRTGGRSLRLGK